jgi:hypothetical protein
MPGLSPSTHFPVIAILQYEILKILWTSCIFIVLRRKDVLKDKLSRASLWLSFVTPWHHFITTLRCFMKSWLCLYDLFEPFLELKNYEFVIYWGAVDWRKNSLKYLNFPCHNLGHDAIIRSDFITYVLYRQMQSHLFCHVYPLSNCVSHEGQHLFIHFVWRGQWCSRAQIHKTSLETTIYNRTSTSPPLYCQSWDAWAFLMRYLRYRSVWP